MTIYQGTKVPPHRYLQYMNIDLYEIHIASKTEMLETNKHGWDNQIMVDNDILIKAY